MVLQLQPYFGQCGGLTCICELGHENVVIPPNLMNEVRRLPETTLRFSGAMTWCIRLICLGFIVAKWSVDDGS